MSRCSKGLPKRKDYGCSYSPMSELSKTPWTTLIPPVAQEEGPRGAGTGPTRDPHPPPRAPETEKLESGAAASRTRSSQAEGTGCRGRGVEGRRGPSPRSGAGALEGATLPGPAVPPQPLPEARTPGAQVWPGRQVQSALAPGRCPPARPPLGLVLPPTFVYSSATAMGRQGSSRAAEMRGSGAGLAAPRPSGR